MTAEVLGRLVQYISTKGPTNREVGAKVCGLSLWTAFDAMVKWIDDGLARRVARVKSGETLWSAAKRMGIPVHELSAMERGRKPFVS